MACTLPRQKGHVPGACCRPSSFSFSSHTHASHILLQPLGAPSTAAREEFVRRSAQPKPESEMKKTGIEKQEREREREEKEKGKNGEKGGRRFLVVMNLKSETCGTRYL